MVKVMEENILKKKFEKMKADYFLHFLVVMIILVVTYLLTVGYIDSWLYSILRRNLFNVIGGFGSFFVCFCVLCSIILSDDFIDYDKFVNYKMHRFFVLQHNCVFDMSGRICTLFRCCTNSF